VLENVVQHPLTREVDYDDVSITENTRASYPIEFIANGKVPCAGGHPRQIIFLSCDAFGVLPPVSKLTPAQAMYHFLSGYTAKVAGTEQGVTEPQATFSACFGAAFLVWHPTKYAQMLARRIEAHGADCWLVNTGWTGGAYGTGNRIPLATTRAIIDAIHSGELARTPTALDARFGLQVPVRCPGVPDTLLAPRFTWRDPGAYEATARKLAGLFQKHFSQYAEGASAATRASAPRVD
jgi:phosphoenolpyruvate carboxykinase (ATP)